MQAKWRLGLLAALVLVRPAGADEPSPVALLRGAEAARAKPETVRVTLTLEDRGRSGDAVVERDCLVEQAGAKRRFEVRKATGSDLGVVVINGTEVHSFRRAKHEDVRVCDLKYAVGVAGDLAFDPRILGLSDLMAADTTLPALLWYADPKAVKLVGPEKLNGVPVWRVRATTAVAESEYWVEPESFRVHRRTTTWPGGAIDITSRFRADDKASPFPERVEIRRVDGPATERTVRVTKFEVGPDLPAGRFGLGGMDLPLNTAVVDYRLHRRLGYWDGKGLSDDPVRPPNPRPKGK
ncbi:MAG TPA: hypothetical protein VKD90_04810 [Gemmataceae bacterium]|nr:hypothetical protein [Gemmataceae bacterium]